MLMETTPLLHSRSLALATVTAAALLALGPGRAAAASPSIFVGQVNGTAASYTATGAAYSPNGYNPPSGFSNPGGHRLQPGQR